MFIQSPEIEMQYNKITGINYQGRNQAELIAIKKANKYNSNAWLTFLQAKELGLFIIKGSKGVGIFKGFQKKEEKNKAGKMKLVSYPVGFATVFNENQTEKK